MKKTNLCFLFLGALMAWLLSAAEAQKTLPNRVFATSRFSMDRLLARPYDSEVPFGASGDRVWATSPQGWAFREGVQLVYLTNLNLFDVVVQAGDENYQVEKAEYFPSHIHLLGAPGNPMTATASFTYTIDRVENPLTKPFKPEKRWTCWSSGRREDWYAVDFGKPRRLTGLDLYFFDDQPVGGCAPPESVRVELYRDGGWHSIALNPVTPQPGKNTLTFTSDQPERAERIRLNFHHRGTDRYTGLYGFDPHEAGESEAKGKKQNVKGESPTPNTQHPTPNTEIENRKSKIENPTPALRVEADKWITQDDVLVTHLRVTNDGKTARPLFVRMDSELSGAVNGFEDVRRVQEIPLYLAASGTAGGKHDTRFVTDIAPGETKTFTFACAVARDAGEARRRRGKVLASSDPLKAQVEAYQNWFDTNIATFECSDPLVTKMYYHRWYNLKKNSLDPKMGALRHKTFAEGRWTADWYANVISYGAAHQVREARWLRDPSYAWGHVQTWCENARVDGIFPSHITPKGQQGGQYTDWIGSTAWDTYLLHPDKTRLERVADPVARNAQSWRKVYGWDNSPLLVVDSHWWTGMEWQPSFFAFARHETGGGNGTDRKYMTPLRRVDLTAYNFGNAQAAARIYRELGRETDAAKLQQLADETRAALLAEMWNPQTHWFHSLRATDHVKAPDKEIIGLYPFYFDLPPRDKGYEAAWEVALDPKLFWTKWPLASAAKDCPAYAQNGWPVGPGGSGCMWNGPTWPHANSLVLTAMANTLRHYAPSALTKQKLYELFYSFTRAQFKNQDPRFPWTGEYYNGDNGEWKTPQRDYNHSTWIDPLLNDLLGIIPRPDNILEIDPLLPDGVWTHYVLDGQAYRGHNLTIAFDAQGNRIAPGFKGYAVFLDGKEILHANRPTRVVYDMEAGRLLP